MRRCARSPSSCLERTTSPRKRTPPHLALHSDFIVLILCRPSFSCPSASLRSESMQGGPVPQLERRAGLDRYPAASHVRTGGSKSGEGGSGEHRHRAADAPGLHGGLLQGSVVFFFPATTAAVSRDHGRKPQAKGSVSATLRFPRVRRRCASTARPGHPASRILTPTMKSFAPTGRSRSSPSA